MATNNLAALKLKDGKTTATGPVYLVHYKITNSNSNVEGSVSIITSHGIRYGSDDMDHVRNVIAESCNESSIITDQYGPVSPDQVMVLGGSPYAS